MDLKTQAITNSKEEDEEVLSDIFSKIPGKYDILLEIFSFLHLKHVLKLQSVSKTIKDLTTKPQFLTKQFVNCKPSFEGLFYKTAMHDFNFNVEFLPIQSEFRFPNPSLDFLKRRSHEDPKINVMDSCNGLLLCTTTTTTTKPFTTTYVCNPLTKEKLSLPYPKRMLGRVHYAILSDMVGFRVVCLHMPKGGKFETELLIYSSEIGEWEEQEERLPELSDEMVMGLRAVFNGSLFWDCFDNHILVFHMNVANKSRPCYELIEAPKAPFGRCLFKFDEKLVCYCHGYDNEFPAWRFQTDINKLPHWKLEDGGEFEKLSEDVSRMYSEGWLHVWSGMPGRVRFKVIGYDHKSCTMYLLLHNSIYSYGLKSRSLDKMLDEFLWDWPHRLGKFVSVVPYMPSLAKIQTRNKQRENEDDPLLDLA